MADEKQQPIITVYDPEKDVKLAINTLQKQQKIINWAMVAVVGVVSLGFIAVVTAVFAIFIDHQDYAEQRYDKYIELLEKNEQQLKPEAPSQENLDIKAKEELEFNQGKPDNDTPPATGKKE